MSTMALPESLDRPTADERGVGGRRRPDVAAYHATGAAAFALVAVLLRGWAWCLLWPAVSSTLVAMAYAKDWPCVFGKRRGVLPAWSPILFGPHLVGLRVAWWVQSHGRTPCAELLPGLWIGRRPGQDDCEELLRRGVRSTLDLSAELPERPALRGAGYHNVPILDLTLPDVATLDRAVRVIAHAMPRGAVYVHCALGYGRTAVIAAAYLLASGHAATVDAAVARVCGCRPGCAFPPRVRRLLETFRAACNDAATVPRQV